MLVIKDIYQGACIRTKILRGRRAVQTEGLLSAVVYDAQVTMSWDSKYEHWVIHHTGRRLTRVEKDKDTALQTAKTWDFPEWHQDRQKAEQDALEQMAERIKQRRSR